uniref:Uncharacterized protein n=1 Tax=Anguilla anguilla TaxID=7936 RepID=A0A0E9QI88_ANGAN
MAETHSLQDIRQQAAIAAKVFIQRDYTNGTVCQFQTKFPSELETRRLKSSSVAGCHAVTWKCLWIQNSKDRTWFSLCFVYCRRTTIDFTDKTGLWQTTLPT